MIVDLFKDKLINSTSATFSWEEDEDSSEDCACLSTICFCDLYKNRFEVYVYFESDGGLTVDFVLVGIEKCEAILKLVNHFNRQVSPLKAFLAEKRGLYNLYIRREVIAPSEEKAVEEVLSAFESLESPETERYLEPLDVIAG